LGSYRPHDPIEGQFVIVYTHYVCLIQQELIEFTKSDKDMLKIFLFQINVVLLTLFVKNP